MIRYKTAKLFEAGTRLGAILAGADADTEAAFARYGMHLAPPSRLLMTYSIIPVRPMRSAKKTWATIWPKASPRCR